jgi:hypothetical protein
MPSTNSIENFKNNFGGGTRNNRFEVIANWPAGISIDDDDNKFKIFATSLPRSDIGTITVGYRGRTINFAGDRTYGTWEISIYDDNNTKNIWTAMHTWKEKIDGHVTHVKTSASTGTQDFSYSDLQTTWKVNQLGLNGDIIRSIEMYKCWPSVVGGIVLDQSSSTQASFSVTMVFDYFDILTGV